MNTEQTQQFNMMISQVKELYLWMQEKKRNQITFPADDMSRKTLGVGFIGKTSVSLAVAGLQGAETVTIEAVIVNTNEGPLKFLIKS